MSRGVPLTPLEPWIAAKIRDAGRPLRRDALQHHQLDSLNETLARVQARSAFYRRTLGAGGLHLSRLEEIADLPFTCADDLRTAPLDLVCVGQDEIERIVTLATSGTTGPPKRIFFTARDQDLTRDFFHHGMSTLVGPGDRVLILLPGSLPGSVGDLLKDGLERLGVQAIPHGPVADVRHTLDIIARQGVAALVGIPVQVLWLLKASLAGGAPRPRGWRLRSVLLSTDRVPYVVERALREAWGCDVYNHYGTTEMGLGGAVDCRARCGYHAREADLLFEVVDPVTGRPLPDGAEGELVFTTLTREAMPLVRYRTGDLGCFIPGPCECGTVLRRMAHVHGRLGTGVDLGDGTIIYQRDLDEALLPLAGLADFRVLFGRQRGVATFVIRVRACDVGSEPDADEIVGRVMRMPAVTAFKERGEVAVEVADWDPADGERPGTAKRQIADLKEAGA